MSPETSPQRAPATTFFGLLERGVLFLLSLAIGLVDLAIAVFVAGHLGIIPRKTVNRIVAAIERVPVVGSLFKEEPSGSAKPAPSRPAAKRPAR